MMNKQAVLKTISSSITSKVLSRLSVQWPNYDFCISQGSVVTVLRWGDQNQSFVSSFFLMSHAKNYYNQSMFHEAIRKVKVAAFYGPRCITGYEYSISTHNRCRLADQRIINKTIWRSNVLVLIKSNFSNKTNQRTQAKTHPQTV